MGLLLFMPVGTFRYWQAWLYLSVFTCACALTTLYLVWRDPALLKRRMSGGPTAEKRATQKIIMLFVSVAFVALLDWRRCPPPSPAGARLDVSPRGNSNSYSPGHGSGSGSGLSPV